jgi:hypothetical protein
MLKGGVILWSMLLLTVVGIDPRFACSCPEYPAFEQTARQSDTVVVGRVAKVVRNVPGWHSFERGRPSPVYVDVNVERVLKGSQNLQPDSLKPVTRVSERACACTSRAIQLAF